jgi:3-oxoacyl-[acyl-carrier protein] reductase
MYQKIALVTGSTQGIGKAIAKYLIQNNYIVYINGRDIEKLKKIQKVFGGNTKIIHADLTDDYNIKNAINKIIKRDNRLDLVVANIGSGKSKVGWNVNIDEYKRIFDINFFSAVSLARYSIDSMKKNGGNIIFINSIAGCEVLGAPITYSSAKTALLGFAKSLANDVAKLNIRVNSISPGNVMFKGSTWDYKTKKDKNFVEKYIENNVPLNKFAKPKDIAKAVIFLEQNNFITGTNIIIDGGQIKKII